MPKYYDFMICGYYLYFTSHCIVEAMHVHASDRHLTESGSAKLFVMGNGDTVVKEQGVLTNKEAQVRKSVDSPAGMLTEDHHHTVHEESQVCYSSHLRPKSLHL